MEQFGTLVITVWIVTLRYSHDEQRYTRTHKRKVIQRMAGVTRKQAQEHVNVLMCGGTEHDRQQYSFHYQPDPEVLEYSTAHI